MSALGFFQLSSTVNTFIYFSVHPFINHHFFMVFRLLIFFNSTSLRNNVAMAMSRSNMSRMSASPQPHDSASPQPQDCQAPPGGSADRKKASIETTFILLTGGRISAVQAFKIKRLREWMMNISLKTKPDCHTTQKLSNKTPVLRQQVPAIGLAPKGKMSIQG